MTSAVASAAHSLRRQIEQAEEKLRTLELIPAQDDYVHGSVVRVTVRPRYGNDAPLLYILLKIVVDEERWNRGTARERWYFTGAPAGRSTHVSNRGYMTFSELVSWLVNDVVVERWEDLTVRVSVQQLPTQKYTP